MKKIFLRFAAIIPLVLQNKHARTFSLDKEIKAISVDFASTLYDLVANGKIFFCRQQLSAQVITDFPPGYPIVASHFVKKAQPRNPCCSRGFSS